VEKIYDAVRNGTFGREAADALTLRELSDRYFSKYVSTKTGRPLGRNERYRWNVMIETVVDRRPLGDYVATEIKKHHVEAFVDANRVERVTTIADARQHIRGEARRCRLDQPCSRTAEGILQLGR
jgi:hypothetical protein